MLANQDLWWHETPALVNAAAAVSAAATSYWRTQIVAGAVCAQLACASQLNWKAIHWLRSCSACCRALVHRQTPSPGTADQRSSSPQSRASSAVVHGALQQQLPLSSCPAGTYDSMPATPCGGNASPIVADTISLAMFSSAAAKTLGPYRRHWGCQQWR